MTNYAKALTKEDLINRYGITNVTEDGKVYGYAKGILREFAQSTIYTNKGKRHYKVIIVYDHVDKVKVPVIRDGKETYNYKPISLGVHRIVAA